MKQEYFEGVFEIQFPANPIFLDFRGKFAKGLSSEMSMKEWQIIENRIDVFDTEKIRRGIVSYQNCAFIIRNDTSHQNFSDQVVKFLRKCDSLEAIPKDLIIKRLGVRFTYAQEYNGTFDELLHKFTTKLLILPKTTLDTLDANIIDIASPMTLETTEGKIRFQVGPMLDEQVKAYINFAEAPAPVNIFVDLDYWIEPKIHWEFRDLEQTVRNYAKQNSDRLNKIIALIQGD